MWSDALTVLKQENDKKKDDDAKNASSISTGKVSFLYVFLASDFALGLLQMYWIFFGILPKIAAILADDEQ